MPNKHYKQADPGRLEKDDRDALPAKQKRRLSALWYFTHHLGRLRTMSRAETNRVALLADVIAEQHPLEMVTNKFTVEGYAEDMSGFSVHGLLLACVWVLGGEDPVRLAPLMDAYPELPAHAAYATERSLQAMRQDVDLLRGAVWESQQKERRSI